MHYIGTNHVGTSIIMEKKEESILQECKWPGPLSAS